MRRTGKGVTRRIISTGNTMENDIKIPAPVDTGNDTVSVHLSYIRRDIDQIRTDLTKNSQEVRGAIEDLKNAYVTRIDYEEHLKADDDHENRIRNIEKTLWKYVGASSAISAIGSALLVAISQYFIK